MYLGSHPIAWSSKKQTGVARSYTEDEYRAIASTMTEICLILSLISEVGFKSPLNLRYIVIILVQLISQPTCLPLKDETHCLGLSLCLAIYPSGQARVLQRTSSRMTLPSLYLEYAFRVFLSRSDSPSATVRLEGV